LVAGALLIGSLALAGYLRSPTTYAAAGAVPASLAAGAAVLLVLAGLAAWWSWVPGEVGPLAVGLGLAWCAPLWVGWASGPSVARSVAMLVAPFGPALLLHLASSVGGGARGGGSLRRAVLLGYAVTAGYAALRAAVRDPFLDLYCWSNCSDNVFLVAARPGLARALDDLWPMAVILLSGVAVVIAVGRRPLPHAAPLCAAVVGAAVAEACGAVLLMAQPMERPDDPRFMSVFLLRGTGYGAVGLGVAWMTWRTWRTRAAVARLSADLAATPLPGQLEARLASVLGDPSVRVAFPLEDGRIVGPDGREAAPPGPASIRTAIERSGRVVALVDQARRDRHGEAWSERIGAAARLAVDNERLRAALLAQLEDLKASRARIVAESDAERRRLERNLHDGAQQRLLALTYELRISSTQARAAGDAARADVLAEALASAQRAVDELRAIAHRIHPAILTGAGLGPALLSLADEAPVPVQVTELPATRAPEPAERAAFVAAVHALDLAEQLGDPHVEVSASRRDDTLVLSISPGHAALADDMAVIDRIGALGGRVRRTSDAVQVEVPCA
jgi:signal transduction histidine kinase